MLMSGNSNRKYWSNVKLNATRLFWSRVGQNSSSRDANDKVKFYEKRKIHLLLFLVLVIICRYLSSEKLKRNNFTPSFDR